MVPLDRLVFLPVALAALAVLAGCRSAPRACSPSTGCGRGAQCVAGACEPDGTVRLLAVDREGVPRARRAVLRPLRVFDRDGRPVADRFRVSARASLFCEFAFEPMEGERVLEAYLHVNAMPLAPVRLHVERARLPLPSMPSREAWTDDVGAPRVLVSSAVRARLPALPLIEMGGATREARVLAAISGDGEGEAWVSTRPARAPQITPEMATQSDTEGGNQVVDEPVLEMYFGLR